jgi:NIPSNAP
MRSDFCRVVELRRYSLLPNSRETLIEVFDRELVEPQEALGMHILGQFRDLDDPDSFVWLRGFTDMGARQAGLESFYTGPVWKQHAATANATMDSVDNVLLLRPVSGLVLDTDDRPARDSIAAQPGLLAVTVYPLAEATAENFTEFFGTELEPALRRAGISVLATFVTEHSENTFPALPVRAANVFVWLTILADETEHTSRIAALRESQRWHGQIAPALARRLDGQPETLRLTPTTRSLLHG